LCDIATVVLTSRFKLLSFFYINNYKKLQFIHHTLAWYSESVVRTTIKVDDPLNLLTDRHQIYLRDYVVDIYHTAKLHPDRIRGFFLRMRDFAHQIVYSAICSFFFGGGGLNRLLPRRPHPF